MTFEEEFPNLKDKINNTRQIVNQEITNVIGETGGGYKDDTKWLKSEYYQKVEWILKYTVKKHCLDKLKVRDILNAPCELCKNHDGKDALIQNTRYTERQRIKKELGL